MASFITATPAMANDDDFEFWIGPSVSTDVDDDVTIELQTAQRFRDADRNRADTYYARGWVHWQAADDLTVSFSAEQRVEDGSSDEIRTIQQVEASPGIWRARLRLEQRFIEGNSGRMGLRLRPRLGARVPLSDQSPISASVDAELFWTLRGNSIGSRTGITGFETRVGTEYEISENFTLGLKYLRAQSFDRGRPERVSHAPLIELEFDF